MPTLSDARVLILGADDVEDMELLYPLFRLREEEASVTLATLDGASIRGKKGYGPIEPDASKLTGTLMSAAYGPPALAVGVRFARTMTALVVAEFVAPSGSLTVRRTTNVPALA